MDTWLPVALAFVSVEIAVQVIEVGIAAIRARVAVGGVE